MTKPPTHYALIGVSPAAPTAIIHKAYLELAYVLHPDPGGDEELFKALAAAWGVLKNREFRARYDAELKLLGLNCPACAGRGVTYRSKGFTKREESACAACAGTGRNDL